MDFDALELLIAGRNEDPVAIMQVQHCACRYNCMKLRGFALERCRDKHAKLEHAWVRNFNADLGGANGGIEYGTDVADAASENPIRVGDEPNLRGLSKSDFGDVVFINVADDPYGR